MSQPRTIHLRVGDSLNLTNDSDAETIIRWLGGNGRGRAVCYPGDRWILSNVGPFADLDMARRMLREELQRFGRPRLSVLQRVSDKLEWLGAVKP